MVQEVLRDVGTRMDKSVKVFTRELGSIRTGRTNPAIVENLIVEYYGTQTPLNQLASITVPEDRVLMVQPWDKGSLVDVEKAILK